jgi:hypothetical protein
LNGKETPLDRPEKRSRFPELRMTPTDVRGYQPLHPATQISTVRLRPQQQMRVACHRTTCGPPHRHFVVSRWDQVHNPGEIVIPFEDVAACVGLFGT